MDEILQVNRITDAIRFLLFFDAFHSGFTLSGVRSFIRRNIRERVKIASGLLNSSAFSVALYLPRFRLRCKGIVAEQSSCAIILLQSSERRGSGLLISLLSFMSQNNRLQSRFTCRTVTYDFSCRSGTR